MFYATAKCAQTASFYTLFILWHILKYFNQIYFIYPIHWGRIIQMICSWWRHSDNDSAFAFQFELFFLLSPTPSHNKSQWACIMYPYSVRWKWKSVPEHICARIFVTLVLSHLYGYFGRSLIFLFIKICFWGFEFTTSNWKFLIASPMYCTMWWTNIN